MLPRRRENFEEKQFSFSGPLVMESSGEFETWAERIKSDHYGHFGRASNVKVGAWAKRTTYVNPDEGEFQGLGRKEDEDVPSPTLWEKEGGGGGSRSPAATTKSDEAYPMLGLTMRSQMMARYRKEMIDLVRDVPENAYELSLRDIVEINPSPVLKTELEVKGEEKKDKKKKKYKGGRRMSRSESLDTGLLLRMFVPTTMRRKKSFGAAGVTCSKVSPKPVVADGGGGMEKGPDGEWWMKKDIDELNSSSSSGSSSGGSTSTSSDSSSSSSNNNNKTSSSSSSSSNTGRRKKSRCLPFLNFCKSKTRGA